jgi:DNA-binding PadR family transcriptional regulator
MTAAREGEQVAKRRKVGNIMALALLALLMPGQPMHPYQMANLLRRTGKENDMKIKWGSLYTVIQNLEKHHFIEALSSHREGRRPERTLYGITDAGRAELHDWLRELVAEPEPEFPRFEAALSVLGVLHPDEVLDLLQRRHDTLAAQIAEDRASLAHEEVPRIFLIEAEYALAMKEAEAAWVAGLQEELATGTLNGAAEWRQYHESGTAPPEWVQLLEETGSGAATPEPGMTS